MNINKYLWSILLSASFFQGVSAMDAVDDVVEKPVKALSHGETQSFSQFLLEDTYELDKDGTKNTPFWIAGYNYLNCSKDSMEDAEAHVLLNMQDLTLTQIQKMADDYLQETNIGTIVACHLSEEPYNKDTLKRKGLILVGMAQMMKKLAKEEHVALSELYKPYMYKGVNNVLQAMNYLLPFENEKMEQHFLHLIQLSRLSSPSPLLGDWHNYAKYLTLQYDKQVLDNKAYSVKIMEEMDRVYNGLTSAINSQSFTTPESVNDFFQSKIQSYVMQVLTGELHFPKAQRSVERAIQEAQKAHREMGILTMNLIQKAHPEIRALSNIYKKTQEFLADNWLYNALSNSFAVDQDLPLVEGGVWKELVFDYNTAEEKINSYILSHNKGGD